MKNSDLFLRQNHQSTLIYKPKMNTQFRRYSQQLYHLPNPPSQQSTGPANTTIFTNDPVIPSERRPMTSKNTLSEARTVPNLPTYYQYHTQFTASEQLKLRGNLKQTGLSITSTTKISNDSDNHQDRLPEPTTIRNSEGNKKNMDISMMKSLEKSRQQAQLQPALSYKKLSSLCESFNQDSKGDFLQQYQSSVRASQEYRQSRKVMLTETSPRISIKRIAVQSPPAQFFKVSTPTNQGTYTIGIKAAYSPQPFAVHPKPNKESLEYTLRYSYRSKKGYTPKNPSKINQDACIVLPSLHQRSWEHFFGVCDGHGQHGHQVSSFIKNSITSSFMTMGTFYKSPIQNLQKLIRKVDDKLHRESKIDLSYSGSTAIGCYLSHNRLYVCNVGDSRALIGYKKIGSSTGWAARQLSHDHKPDHSGEADRIWNSKGRVDYMKDQEGNSVGPLRVWLREGETPGLAMTRSLGDSIASNVGVISDPEITEFTLTKNDRMILIASDGIWEFLKNEDIVEKLVPFYEAGRLEEACDFLLEYAHSAWTRHCSNIDDISFILIFMSYH